MPFRRVTCCAAALAATGAFAGAVQAAPPTPMAEITGVDLGAPRLLDGRLFSARPGRPPADPDTRWRIDERTPAGATVDVGHRQSEALRDLDAGAVGARRTPVLTYSRCSSGGCRVHQLDPGTGVDVVVARTHRAGASESYPTRWLDALAFVRTQGGREAVLVRDLGHGRPARTVFGPLPAGTHVTGMDISPRGLAFATLAPKGEGVEARMYVKPTGRPVRRLQRTASGALSRVVVGAPQWQGNDLLWTFSRYAAEPWALLLRARVTASGTTVAQAPVPVQAGEFLDGVAVDPSTSDSPVWVRARAEDASPAGSTTLRRFDAGQLRFSVPPATVGLGR